MSQFTPSGNGSEKPTLRQIIGSALSAAFGVQSETNRLRDFKAGSPKAFIIAGLTATVLFILTVYIIVQLVLAFAGR